MTAAFWIVIIGSLLVAALNIAIALKEGRP